MILFADKRLARVKMQQVFAADSNSYLLLDTRRKKISVLLLITEGKGPCIRGFHGAQSSNQSKPSD